MDREDYGVKGGKRESPSRFRLLVGGLTLIFNALMLVLILLIVGFVLFATGLDRTQHDPEGTADGITVLTGGKARIAEAMRLLSQRKARRVLITGVHRATTKETLKEFAQEGNQLFTCCVDIDHEARNTIDNAAETREWVAQKGYRSLIVVTSNYHMPRALAELGRAMPGVTLIPYSVVDNNVQLERWWLYPGTTKLLLSEYLKYLPALGRLGVTDLVHTLMSEETIAEKAVEP
jgi:uncharacterized SAM-binding protein YcdF (DUF218 family)